MIKNYLKTAIRHLAKYKFFTFINIIGLAVGLAASILLFLYVRYELSYDKFHKDYEQLYRVVSHVKQPGGKTMNVPRTLADMSGSLKKDIPEVTSTCKLYSYEVTLKKDNNLFPGLEMFYTDSSFFDIFSFKIVKGNGPETLRKPGEVIITESLAKKYFGDENPLNKEIKRTDVKYTVGAVIEDIPENSHFDFDILTTFYSLQNAEQFFRQHGFDFFTYFKVKPGVDQSSWMPKITKLADDLARAKMKEFNAEGAFEVRVESQPLSEIHLHSNYNFDIAPQGDINTIYIFSFLAAFILIIAIVNFINLVTAHSEYRSREVGMRKVLGAEKKVIMSQFLIESFLIVLVALILSLVLVEMLAEPVGNLMGSELTVNWLNPQIIIGLIVFAFIIGLISGSYPAFYLSRFDPVRIFSGMSIKGSRNKILQVGLVIVQFGIAIFLITSLIILNRQIAYLNNKDLGFKMENILVIKNISDKLRDSYEPLRDELQKNPSVESVTASVNYPGIGRSVQNAYNVTDKPSESIIIHENRVQHNYIDTYQIPIVEGRKFNKDLKTDSASYIINQTAAKKLGLENPVGKEIYVFQHRGTIIGVMDDFHYRSFHHKIEPLVFTHYSSYFDDISIRLNTQDISESIKKIKRTVREFDQDYYFQHSFIDDVFAEQYRQEKKTNQMITYGAILAIIIALLGLFALSSFTVVKRRQEIGVRKAMGATYVRVVRLLLYDILKWVVLVNLIAWPAAYFFMLDWLQNFAYTIDLKIWMFILGGFLALVIAAVTISLQTFRAAAINPAETLREE
jgi:putative ABC transport system permease protein